MSKSKRKNSKRSPAPRRFAIDQLEDRLVLSAGVPQVAYALDDQWNSGFTANVTIVNDEAVAFDEWTLEFDYTSQIESIWSAQIVSQSGGHYVITGASWNDDLPVGASTSFGFVGSGSGAAPTNFVFPNAGGGGGGVDPTLSVDDVIVTEGDAGETLATFTVELSADATESVAVDYDVASVSATVGTDFAATSGTLTFASGERQKSISVVVFGDQLQESDETFALVLSNAAGATIFDGEGIATIRDDDTPVVPEGVPATPIVSVRDDVPTDGAFTVSFNIYTGINATSWRLLENGVEIHAGDLVANSPNPQTGSYDVTGREFGAYEYQVVVANEIGESASQKALYVVGGASSIVLADVDSGDQALQVTLDQGTSEFDLSVLGRESANYQVATNNRSVVSPSIVNGSILRIDALASGRASVRIEDTETGEVRYLGIRVRTAEGALPGLPDYVAVGSVSEDTPGDLEFWKDFGDDEATGKRIDSRYIYLNGGPETGWRTWQGSQRLKSYLRESLKLGMTPYFVWYNIPDGGDSYFTNKQHLESASYMEAYFRDLKYALETINEIAGDETVGFVLEPDFLGYLMQIGQVPADQVLAMTNTAYAAGLLDSAVDPLFDDSVQGLVRAINYSFSKYAPNIEFGWQFNLWASPGVTTGIPSNGIVHLTDTLGIDAGREAIRAETQAIARYYIDAGILDHGAGFVSIDKYGLDAVGFESSAADDPASSTWFWNADHWNNYLLFAQTLHEESGLPVTLWQLPVGHINGSLATNPYDPSGVFADLSNTTRQYEDSAPTFFLGDTFEADGARFDFFASNEGGDPNVSTSGSTITWGSHIEAAARAGITNILFGAGVGISTDGVGSPPTDGYWWITKTQEYFANPVPLDLAPLPPTLSIDDVVVTEGDSGTTTATFTVRLSRSMEELVTVDFGTSAGTATAGVDFQSAAGTVTFEPGQVTGTVTVAIEGDIDEETDETFVIELSNAAGATIRDAQGVGTILDDDAPPPPPGGGSANVQFVVTDDWGTGFVADMSFTNTGAEAFDGWTLEFDFAHQITNIWNAVILEHTGDHYVVGPESYNRQVAPGASVQFGFQGTPGNVVDGPANIMLNGEPVGSDPALPSLAIGDVSVFEGDSGNVIASFVVSLSAASQETVEVDYATADGSATSPADYEGGSGSLTFSPGETQKTIAIVINGDATVEADETFVVQLATATGATISDGVGQGVIRNDDAPPVVTPDLSVNDVTVAEGDLQSVGGVGFFHTEGNQIVDANGQTVKIAGVNWFGSETTTYTPHGLWARNYRDMMDQMVELGYNTIRLPFSNQLFDADSVVNSINYGLNPELQGLNGLQIMDEIVDYAGEIGLRIILDNHRSDAGASAQESGLWYTAEYSEARWIADWQMLAARYAGNPTVIGADLRNEPHASATWGSGDLATDWRLAAERAGNAILEGNSDWLIFVEGIEVANGGAYWWGGNLSAAGEFPVRLDVENRLVYSPHAYPASVYNQPWFNDPSFPANLPGIWDDNWGYLFREGIAPVMLGEFGSNLVNPLDEPWVDAMVKYLAGDLDGDGDSDLAAGQQGISWTWWSWNPNSGDTGGILDTDWQTVRQDKHEKLVPLQFEFSNDGGAGGPQITTAVFTVSLSEATTQTVTVSYATAGGSATSDVDFESNTGTLTFAPGETSKQVSVRVLGDVEEEGDETFSLRLSAATNANLVDDTGAGLLVDNDDPPPPLVPMLTVADTQVTEGDDGQVFATFTVLLSESVESSVTLEYATANGAAIAGEDYQATSGTLTFDPGVVSQMISVPVHGDAVIENDETFQLLLSNPVNAELARAAALATIVDDDAPPAQTEVVFTVTDDWGAGFTGAIVILNDTGVELTDWTLEFDFEGSLNDIWNAEIVSHVGSHYVIRGASWNSVLGAGSSVSFGFTATRPNSTVEPTNYVLGGSGLGELAALAALDEVLADDGLDLLL